MWEFYRGEHYFKGGGRDEDDLYEENPLGEDLDEDDLYEENPLGEDLDEDDLYEENPLGEDLDEDNLYEENPLGEDLDEDDLYEENPLGEDLDEDNLYEENPLGEDLDEDEYHDSVHLHLHDTLYLYPALDFLSYDEHDYDEQQTQAHTQVAASDWPELWSLAEERDWEGVLERLDSNPDEAKIYVGQWYYGCTFFHLGLQLNMPIEVMRKVVALHPDALSMNAMSGNLPLHYILSRGHWTPDELEVIVKGYPEAASVCDSFQRSPLHILMNKYPLDTDLNLQSMKILLNIAPGTALTENGSVGYRNNAWTRIVDAWNTNTSENLWEMTKLILRARYYSRHDQGKKCQVLILHAAILEDPHPFRNENLRKKILEECHGEAKQQIFDGITPLNFCISSICMKWDDGLKYIYEAAPVAAIIRDSASKLFPFQLAACNSDTPDLNTIYELCKEWSGCTTISTLLVRNRY